MNTGRYEDGLKYGKFNWPVKFCTVGRKVPNPVERKESLVRDIHLETLLRILRHTDWAKTPIHEMYCEHKRWKHLDDEILSEVECKYVVSKLTNMINKDNYDEKKDDFRTTEGIDIVESSWA